MYPGVSKFYFSGLLWSKPCIFPPREQEVKKWERGRGKKQERGRKRKRDKEKDIKGDCFKSKIEQVTAMESIGGHNNAR